MERICSASGPTEGVIEIAGKQPKDVVFIKCVGSRDQSIDNPWCSRVCCMFTAKQAHLVREKLPDANITIFYMDVRAFGKGFEEFYDRVKNEGVDYRRGSVSEIYRKGERLVVRGGPPEAGAGTRPWSFFETLARPRRARGRQQELGNGEGGSRATEHLSEEAATVRSGHGISSWKRQDFSRR